ncbi:MAG: hypothetical protein A2498_14345 [Lentisphaerae bacterium RIFOXYC12_FULL_60_16]|nr:MAG: hypothetical protein A2498_14345 [Lentisphaerae bacterium RIFOXYC12_FULL_60_16]
MLAAIRRARKYFLAMAGSYFLGVFNDNFFKQAILLIAVAAARPDLQAVVPVVFTVPYLLVAAPAGWLADRFPRRWVIIACKLIELLAMLVAAAGLVLFDGRMSLFSVPWMLVLLMIGLMGLQSSLFSPSLNGSIPDLYPASYVMRANGVLKMVVIIAILFGIAGAGLTLDLETVTGLPDWLAQAVADRPGQAVVAGILVLTAAIGFVLSFGVPFRPAANSAVSFPWSGPVRTFRDLYAMRTDRLLVTCVWANTFFWFLGAVLVLFTNDLGINQFKLSASFTSGLVVVQMIGVGVGSMLCARLTARRPWHQVLCPAMLGMAVALAGVGLLPAMWEQVNLPYAWRAVTLLALFALTGVCGGVYLIPLESQIQLLPAAEQRGRMIAAANFAAMVGVTLSGPVYGLFMKTGLKPSHGFILMAVLGFGMVMVLKRALKAMGLKEGNPMSNPETAGPVNRGGEWLNRLLIRVSLGLLGLRYRVEVQGLDTLKAPGGTGVLLLPNHHALIDPVLLISHLYRWFRPRPLADEYQVNRPFIAWLCRRFRVVILPNLDRRGVGAADAMKESLERVMEALRRGDNVLLYPAGRIKRSIREELGAKSAVETIVRAVPDVRLVMVRQNGLWGSSFSWGGGVEPQVGPAMLNGLKVILLNGLWFVPKRRVVYELVEPADFPRTADRAAMNAWMESFYNRDPWPNTRVPYRCWEREGEQTIPEPASAGIQGDSSAVPEGVRSLVLEKLATMSGKRPIQDADRLSYDLGIDSLAAVDLVLWVEQEFGFHVGTPEALRTVADVLLCAAGQGISMLETDLRPVGKGWWRSGRKGAVPIDVPPGTTLAEVFLRRAAREPDRVALADQLGGEKTYRDVITALHVLRPVIQSIEGDYVGIMLPASAGSVVLYLAVMFGGKVPVMINWTTGVRTINHSLETLGVRGVITSQVLVGKLQSMGIDCAALKTRLILTETLAQGITTGDKLRAVLRSWLNWSALRQAAVHPTAVVLFTSGTENLPKAVPLTHANILTNIRDTVTLVHLTQQDALIGFLPPFHSFGLTVSMLFPLCAGLRTVYHANPTESANIARLCDAYKPTMVLGTPTFLGGIVRAAKPEQLASLRLAVTGAEQCPAAVYEALKKACPGLTVLEGYGITECSPIVSANGQDHPVPYTIGKVMPSLEYALMDPEKGTACTPGATGMLLVRGPSIFAGYLNHTADSPFVEFAGKTWYKTGDLVSEGTGGVLTFKGRLKRFIKLGGEMISLPAIESALMPHFQSDDAEGPPLAVEATPREDAPEIILFAVQPVDRNAANELLKQAGFTPLSYIRRVVQVKAIPVLGTGKTDYRALKAMLQDAG